MGNADNEKRQAKPECSQPRYESDGRAQQWGLATKKERESQKTGQSPEGVRAQRGTQRARCPVTRRPGHRSGQRNLQLCQLHASGPLSFVRARCCCLVPESGRGEPGVGLSPPSGQHTRRARSLLSSDPSRLRALSSASYQRAGLFECLFSRLDSPFIRVNGHFDGTKTRRVGLCRALGGRSSAELVFQMNWEPLRSGEKRKEKRQSD